MMLMMRVTLAWDSQQLPQEARKTTTFIWWNVWVLLAMPAVWLAWFVLSAFIAFARALTHSHHSRAMFFFITAILSFVWRSGSTSDSSNPAPLSPTAVLGPRIAITSLFLLGLVYFVMIVKTLQNYGRTHDTDDEMRMLSGADSDPNPRSSTEGERGRERDDRGRRPAHHTRSRGRQRAKGGRPGGDRPSEGGVLSAVTGLGLTNLDGIPSSSSPRSSGEVSREKEKAVGSSVIALA
jgi:hypothetical protein